MSETLMNESWATTRYLFYEAYMCIMLSNLESAMCGSNSSTLKWPNSALTTGRYMSNMYGFMFPSKYCFGVNVHHWIYATYHRLSCSSWLATIISYLLAVWLTRARTHFVAYLCDSRPHLSSSDDHYMFNNDISGTRGGETSADLVCEESHGLWRCLRSRSRETGGRSVVTWSYKRFTTFHTDW